MKNRSIYIILFIVLISVTSIIFSQNVKEGWSGSKGYRKQKNIGRMFGNVGEAIAATAAKMKK